MLATQDAGDAIASTVLTTISELMSEQDLDVSLLAESAKLVDTLGLKSMDIAQVVLILEDELEVDPFQETPITSIRTVGDLIAAYKQATGESDSDAAPTAPATAPVGVSRRANRRR